MNILLIEDDLSLVKTVVDGFKEEGFCIDVVTSLAIVNTYLSMKKYDIIILDKNLPDGDGLLFCLQLKQEEIDIPILILTSCSKPDQVVVGFENGADDYLTKPFYFPELVARVRNLSRRKSSISSHVLKANTITLNVISKEVKVDNQPVELRNNEFNILLFLVKRKNSIVSKDELVDNIWNIDNFNNPNILNVTMHNLRKKIDPDGNNIIHTIRGIGYKLVE